MLVHHANASGQRRARIARRQGLAVHADLARVGGVVPKQDGHQSGFARTVFAQQRQHLTRAQLNGANLRNADLTGANLTNADLRDADLTGAEMGSAVLEGAVVCDAIFPNGKKKAPC